MFQAGVGAAGTDPPHCTCRTQTAEGEEHQDTAGLLPAPH